MSYVLVGTSTRIGIQLLLIARWVYVLFYVVIYFHENKSDSTQVLQTGECGTVRLLPSFNLCVIPQLTSHVCGA